MKEIEYMIFGYGNTLKFSRFSFMLGTLFQLLYFLKLFELGLSNLIRKIGKFFQEKGANLGLLMFDHFQNYLSQVSMVFESENDQAERWLPKRNLFINVN